MLFGILMAIFSLGTGKLSFQLKEKRMGLDFSIFLENIAILDILSKVKGMGKES
jgi:hypothetical protein